MDNNRRNLLIALFVLGWLLIAGGLWWRFSDPAVPVPTGFPVIAMQEYQKQAGTQNYLYIYADRSVLYIQESETREDLDRQGLRIWRSSELSKDEFASLIKLVEDNIDLLDDSYQYPGYLGSQGTLHKGDMDTLLSINFGGLRKEIVAKDYLSLYSSYATETYAGLPPPLADICEKLWKIGLNTVEYQREEIP